MYRDCLPKFAAHLRDRGHAETTVRNYQRVALRWRNSHRPPADWLAGIQERSRAGDPAGRPTGTAKGYEAALRAYLTFKGDDPARATLPAVLRYARPRAQQALTRPQEGRLRAALEGDEVPEPVRTLIRLMLDTGLRSAEARSLRLSDLEQVDGVLVLRVLGKGGRERMVPVPSATRAAMTAYLRGWLAHRAGTYLFPSPGAQDGPIGRTVLSEALSGLRDAVGAERLTPHTLRHTRATRMAEAGVPAPVAGAVLGHRQVGTTLAYQRAPDPGVMRSALETGMGSEENEQVSREEPFHFSFESDADAAWTGSRSR